MLIYLPELKKKKKNAGNGISETLDLKMFCKSMPPDFLVWTAFTARYYLLVRSQKSLTLHLEDVNFSIGIFLQCDN